MYVVRGEKTRFTRLILLCGCLLLLLSACQNSSGSLTAQNTNKLAALATATQTETSSIPIQLPDHPGITPTQGSNQGMSPGSVPAGSGGVPAAFPHYFSFGVMNGPGNASLLDTMRSQNGTAYAFRYQYLSAGVNTHAGWETWNTPAGVKEEIRREGETRYDARFPQSRE
jgi:hypothetical protein